MRWLRALWELAKRILGIGGSRVERRVKQPNRQVLIKLREGPELHQIERDNEVVLMYGDVNLTEVFQQAGALTATRVLRQSFPRYVEALRGRVKQRRSAVGPESPHVA